MTTHTVDTFVDTSGTALESHTPDSGGPWSNLGGDAGALQISSSNRLSKVSSTHGAGIWAVDTGSNDHFSAVTINAGSSWPNSLVYIAARVQDANNCYYLGHNSATGFFIRKYVGGSFTNLVTFSSSIATGDVFELHAVGNVLTAYHNGSPISGGSVTDTTGSGGGAQFPTGSNCGLIVVGTASGPSMFAKFEADAIGGGGTTTNKTLTASFTANGGLKRSIAKKLTASFTASAKLIRKIIKTIRGSFTATAALTKAKVKLLKLAASFTASGALKRRIAKIFPATFAGNATAKKQVRKTLAASFTATARRTVRITKKLTGSFTANAGLAKSKVRLMLLTASFTAQATFARILGKLLMASFGVQGAMSKVATIGNIWIARAVGTANWVATSAGSAAWNAVAKAAAIWNREY